MLTKIVARNSNAHFDLRGQGYFTAYALTQLDKAINQLFDKTDYVMMYKPETLTEGAK